MINKESLWFVTLFSLILVLGIYYVTLGDEKLFLDNVKDSEPVINLNESDILTSLKVASDEQRLEQIMKYENILLDNTASVEEKNDAYDGLKNIQSNTSKAEEIKILLKEKFSFDTFVEIKNDNINITVSNKEHDLNIANNIIREVQDLYKRQMYITVKFS